MREVFVRYLVLFASDFFSIIFIMFVVFDVACLLRVVYTIQRKQIACVFFVHIQLNTCSE